VLVLAAATAKAASDKGCSATLWFIARVLVPGVALAVALFLDERSVKECPRCVRRISHDAPAFFIAHTILVYHAGSSREK